MAELLAPAGQLDSGYAALHYGADAVYLGLDRFSARAEAVNFTPEELAAFTAHAHGPPSRRNVYLTLNTLVKDGELADAAETLAVAAECGVDAVIVQDLGVAALVKRHFPSLRLHASTQMAIHNLDGALAARDIGCDRVTLARELTLAEVAGIVEKAGVEIEVFIHGTLCYSYSGLCLFSSMATGRSGNRGRCVYSCREEAATPAGRAHPFSLKDMALGERVLEFARMGVASLKIEGRKKSPLYVAATVDYYRRILDGETGRSLRETEARLKTIFARPWTRLFVDGRRNPDAADPEVVGHRGSPLGAVEDVVWTPAGPAVLFRPGMAVERHDGIQIDIPGVARPYGFPVDNLYVFKGGGRAKAPEPVFAAEAGAVVAVPLPPDAPPLRPGLPLYLASSQAVKRSYPFPLPKGANPGARAAVDVAVTLRRLESGGAEAVCGLSTASPTSGAVYGGGGAEPPIAFELVRAVKAFEARDAASAEQAARKAFGRDGANRFQVGGWSFSNPDALYVRPGDWNALRRDALAGLGAAYDERLRDFASRLRRAVEAEPGDVPAAGEAIRWSVFADSPAFLRLFTKEDFAGCAEIIVGVGNDGPDALMTALAEVEERAGRDAIRLALPTIQRDAARDRALVERLWENGWRKWLAGNLSGWRMLAGRDGLDLSADWTLYAMNRLAVGALLDMGFSAFALSPEDDEANMRALVRRFPAQSWAVAHSHVPLFISAACAHAHLGLCGTGGGDAEPPAGCGAAKMDIVMERSGEVEIWPTRCGSVVTAKQPYVPADREALVAAGVRNFRVELRWRQYAPEEALSVWRRLRAGSPVAGTAANFRRGLL